MGPNRTLPVELTNEQARLYFENPTFKQGVDAFLRGVLPLYLDGLAAKAVYVEEMEACMRAAMIEQSSFRTLYFENPTFEQERTDEC